MRWRTPLFLGAAVLAVAGAISAFIAFGAQWKESSPFDEGVISERCGTSTEWQYRQEGILTIADGVLAFAVETLAKGSAGPPT